MGHEKGEEGMKFVNCLLKEKDRLKADTQRAYFIKLLTGKKESLPGMGPCYGATVVCGRRIGGP